VVRQADATAAVYRQALGWAETACRLAPESGACRTTEGIAQYRVGLHAEALKTLSQAARAHGSPQPADLAFQAMSYQQLGQKDQAQRTLAQLREAIQEPDVGKNAEALAYLAEAEALVLKSARKP
jgi:tetratricopeptide (TPR) repeat protein